MSKKKEEEIFDENIKTVYYAEEMEQSYIDYAMSVITARAVPDVRDGLKPVQRRVLYAMSELGLKPSSAYKKSARIVGDAMGKYHPHGDSSIYEALVNMSKEWSYNQPLIDGHGNFGSIEGDGAAAMRYTEARLGKFADEIYLQDLDKDVIDFVPNFDDSEIEPGVLPVRIPSLIVNGSEGIAVGMTTHIPSHNINEVIDATIAYMNNNKISTEELMEYIKGPDFATGGVVSNKDELLNIYETGQGKVRIRGKVSVDINKKNGHKNILITEIPCTMIGAIDKFMETVASLYRNKTIPDLVDIKNISDKEGVKIVIELKKNADVDNVINILYKKAKLEDTFGVNMLAICNGKPKILSLKQMLEEFVNFQTEVQNRKYSYLLNKEEKRREVREGLIKACDCIDLIIEILRGSKTVSDTKECLMYGKTENIKFKHKSSEKDAKQLCFSEVQADAILDMKLQRLIGLEIEALRKELATSEKNIKHYTELLNSPVKMKNLIKKELAEINSKYISPRKTEVINAEQVVIKKVEIEEQNVVVLIDRFGYAKVIDSSLYNKQKDSINNDYKTVVELKNTDKLCIFTDKTNMHSIKVTDIPMGKVKDKGVPLENISNLSSDENILLMDGLENIRKSKLCFLTKQGMIKQVAGEEFDVVKRTIDSTKLKENDTLVGISIINGDDNNCLIATENGYFIRFNIENITILKKNSVGVRAIKLQKEDMVLSFKVGNPKSSIIYKDTEISFDRVKLSARDNKGTKLRI